MAPQHQEIPTSADGHGSSTTAMTGPAATIEPYTIGLAGVNMKMDYMLQCILLGTMGSLAIAVLLLRLLQLARGHLRHLLGMNSDKKHQAYFARNNSQWWPRLKKHVIYAPLFRKRHNRELRLSSAVNIGTLPTRFQTLILGLYLLSNLAYCSILDYNVLNKYAILAELRGRSGTLAVTNMVPLVLFAGRNNPLISVLQLSFDTYNLLHRWMGRIVVVESVVHTAAWMVSKVAMAEWGGVWVDMKTPFMLWGGVAVAATVLLAVFSPGPVRHAFYETFLNLHILLAIALMLGTYLHCNIAKLPPLPWVIAAIGLWIADRLFRVFWTLKQNFSRHGLTKAEMTVLPGDACRLTLHLPHHVDIKPGSHAYLRFLRLNVWESHPFSIIWTEDGATTSEAAVYRSDSNDTCIEDMERDTRKAPSRTSVSFIVQAKTGLTRRLLNFAAANGRSGFQTYALFEGPYAGHHCLDSYGHVVLFAGASGITHQIPYVRHLLRGHEDGTVATQRIVLVWVIRELEHVQWAQPWITTLLSMSGPKGIFDLRVFVTKLRSGPKSEHEDAGGELETMPGRPNVAHIINAEVNQQVGAMCVTVCGPGGLADDVRRAVRDVQAQSFVDFIEESFTW